MIAQGDEEETVKSGNVRIEPSEIARSPRTSSRLDAGAFGLLLVLLAAAPVMETLCARAGGSGPALAASTGILEISAFVLAAATLMGPSRRRRAGSWPGVSLAAIAAIAAFGVLQILPLPKAFLEIVAPENAKFYHELARALRALGGSAVASARISLAPRETAAALLVLGADIALFVASSRLASSRSRRMLLPIPVWIFATLSVARTIARYSGGERPRDFFAGTDDLAAYLQLALILVFGALWTEVLTAGDRTAWLDSRPRELERRLRRLAGWLFLWIFFAVGLVLTGSGLAILVAVETVLLLLGMAFRRGHSSPSRRNALAVSLAVTGAAIVGLVLGSSAASRWMQQDTDAIASRGRQIMWATSLKAWMLSPTVGSGFGAFGEAFRRVQPRDLPGRIERAPSNALDVLVAGGVVGAGLVLLLLLTLFAHFFRLWKRQRHREQRVAVLTALGALFALSLTGLFVGALSSVSIQVTLACVLGAGWSAGGDP